MDDLLHPSPHVRQRPREQRQGTVGHQKVVLGVFEHHVDGLFLEHDLAQCGEIDIIQFTVELVDRKDGQRRSRDGRARDITMISRQALWLMPVYATSSPSLSGLNFLMATTSPSTSAVPSLSLPLAEDRLLSVGVPVRVRALYTLPYVPDEMKPTIEYVDRTDRRIESRCAR
jgi:hypothetical protein